MPQPNKIPLAFAASGDKNIIPESTETIGLASWRDGFPAITSTPFSEGGIAPKRADFNGIFNALSQAVMWMQQGGVYTYDAATDYEVGNVVLYSGNLYKCLSANGPSSAVKAPTDATVWSKVMTAADAAALYLPLSGGTLTGDVVLTSGKKIVASNNASWIALYGGTGWADGVLLQLYGKNDPSNPGAFSIRADNGSDSSTFIGRPDGTLTWGGKSVETNISNTTAYYRLSNGLQILTGSGLSSSSGPKTETFSHAFDGVPRVMITGYGTTTTQFSPKCEVTTTGFNFVCVGANNSYINGASIRWLAFGIGA